MSKRAHLIANKKSGKGHGSTLAERARAIAREVGAELIDYDIKSPEDFARRAEEAVDAAEKDGGVVIAAGGDGTIRGVAQAAHGRNVRFAAVPCGTFNFFARAHRIPEDHDEAIKLALTGEAKPVRLGLVNGQVFLINASLGLYAKAIRERESATSRFGRNRLVVIASTFRSLLDTERLLTVELVRDGRRSEHRTPMIFIGNNALQLRDLKFSVARCMKDDLLAVVMMKKVTKLETWRILARGLFKTLDHEERLVTDCVEDLVIRTHKARVEVALDGELFKMDTPLQIQARPGILNLVKPT